MNFNSFFKIIFYLGFGKLFFVYLVLVYSIFRNSLTPLLVLNFILVEEIQTIPIKQETVPSPYCHKFIPILTVLAALALLALLAVLAVFAAMSVLTVLAVLTVMNVLAVLAV